MKSNPSSGQVFSFTDRIKPVISVNEGKEDVLLCQVGQQIHRTPVHSLVNLAVLKRNPANADNNTGSIHNTGLK